MIWSQMWNSKVRNRPSRTYHLWKPPNRSSRQIFVLGIQNKKKQFSKMKETRISWNVYKEQEQHVCNCTIFGRQRYIVFKEKISYLIIMKRWEDQGKKHHGNKRWRRIGHGLRMGDKEIPKQAHFGNQLQGGNEEGRTETWTRAEMKNWYRMVNVGKGQLRERSGHSGPLYMCR